MSNSMNKRGQSISINTIIIAAIALAVLVVLFAIFTGRLNLFSTGVKAVTDCKQTCTARGFDNGEKGGLLTEQDPCVKPREQLLGLYVMDSGDKRACCCYNTN